MNLFRSQMARNLQLGMLLLHGLVICTLGTDALFNEIPQTRVELMDSHGPFLEAMQGLTNIEYNKKYLDSQKDKGGKVFKVQDLVSQATECTNSSIRLIEENNQLKSIQQKLKKRNSKLKSQHKTDKSLHLALYQEAENLRKENSSKAETIERNKGFLENRTRDLKKLRKMQHNLTNVNSKRVEREAKEKKHLEEVQRENDRLKAEVQTLKNSTHEKASLTEVTKKQMKQLEDKLEKYQLREAFFVQLGEKGGPREIKNQGICSKCLRCLKKLQKVQVPTGWLKNRWNNFFNKVTHLEKVEAYNRDAEARRKGWEHYKTILGTCKGGKYCHRGIVEAA